jgi:hypothetical protein
MIVPKALQICIVILDSEVGYWGHLDIPINLSPYKL